MKGEWAATGIKLIRGGNYSSVVGVWEVKKGRGVGQRRSMHEFKGGNGGVPEKRKR